IIKRVKYSVKGPNALWHLDGHHKLIWWGIVLHGFVDGFSRTVCKSYLAIFFIETKFIDSCSMCQYK
ncbi:hypothetical protein CPB84DRAFT_1691779, partial [Gymnopilus junonius]